MLTERWTGHANRMLARIGAIIAVAAVVTVGASGTTGAVVPPPLPLGFTIDTTQGYAGDTVNGHVNTTDIAANCNTTEQQVADAFAPITYIDNNTGEVTGLMADPNFQHMFFPTDFDLLQWANDPTYYWDTYEHVAYGMIELITGFTADGFITFLTLPQTFIMSFADPITQRPLGEFSFFDPTTGDGSTIVPNLPAGPAVVAAACVIPDPDRVALAVQAGAQFLQDYGVPVGPPDPNYDYFDVLFSHGKDLIAEMMVPKAFGIRPYTVLVAVCGNHVLDPGEQCDDGNTVDGDCCSATCQFEQAGSSCTDNNVCTDDSCDGAGTCVSTPVSGRACDDGNACTDDSCDDAGTCVGTPVNGRACDDGDACTSDDLCNTNGSCVGTPIDCADTNPCTIDSCNSAGGAFLCEHDNCATQPGAMPGPDCDITCFDNVCGNGRVDAPGETCDPPDPTPDPNHCDFRNPTSCQPKCRPDCTSCGDGVVQGVDGETCDDGNLVGGCQAKPHTNRDLDACQNNCTPPLCGDPSKIVMLAGLDRFDVHGRIRPVTPATTVDPPGNQFVLELRAPDDSVLFRASLLSTAAWRAVGRGGWKYRNSDASSTGGIERAYLKPVGDQYRVLLRAMGDLSAAQSLMETHLHVGIDDWTITGEWTPSRSGWRLTQRDATGN